MHCMYSYLTCFLIKYSEVYIICTMKKRSVEILMG